MNKNLVDTKKIFFKGEKGEVSVPCIIELLDVRIGFKVGELRVSYMEYLGTTMDKVLNDDEETISSGQERVVNMELSKLKDSDKLASEILKLLE